MSGPLAIRTSAAQYEVAANLLGALPGVEATRTWLRFDSPEALRSAAELLQTAEAAKPVALDSLRRKAAGLLDGPPPEPEEREELVEVPAGCRVPDPGAEFSVRGEGRFRFARLADGGRSATCWGPIRADGSTVRAGWRTFRLERIATIHRKARGRAA